MALEHLSRRLHRKSIPRYLRYARTVSIGSVGRRCCGRAASIMLWLSQARTDARLGGSVRRTNAAGRRSYSRRPGMNSNRHLPEPTQGDTE